MTPRSSSSSALDSSRLQDWPLRWETPESWAIAALAQPVALLNDHAHLEKKAAANALELLPRWPERDCPEQWSATLAAVARDEAEHLAVVLKLLTQQGGKLSKFHRNPYAGELRKLVRLATRFELMDRLMVSAMIEARSCERFEKLGAALEAGHGESTVRVALGKLYRGLAASERGHHHVFLQLAGALHSENDVARRWDQMLDLEAALLPTLPAGPTMHAGLK